MYDKVVLSRAWASLPATLQIFRLGESTGSQFYIQESIYGVYLRIYDFPYFEV